MVAQLAAFSSEVSYHPSYGAANVIAQFELFFLAGFTYAWWLTFNNIVWLFILLSGFIIYRYRESRVMTLAQFFEMRYSRRFRLFMGVLAFLSERGYPDARAVHSAEESLIFALPPELRRDLRAAQKA